MKIQPIAHKTLAETIAGRLAASLLDGSLAPGAHFPPERDLMSRLGVSRATLREALKAMGRSDLIGNGKHHLIPSFQPITDGSYQSARRKNSTSVHGSEGTMPSLRSLPTISSSTRVGVRTFGYFAPVNSLDGSSTGTGRSDSF